MTFSAIYWESEAECNGNKHFAVKVNSHWIILGDFFLLKKVKVGRDQS